METIVEFRVGLMPLTGGRLVPDPRKGLLRVAQDEAGLTHLLWFERDAAGGAAAEPEKDVVIFPGESTFSKIARPGSRVFELKFPEEKHRTLFFWAQEAAADEDDDYVAAVNAAINLAGGDSDDSGAAAMDADSAPAAAPAAAGGGGGAPGPIAASDLAAVLGSILSGAGGAGGGGGGLRQRMADPGPGLGEVLKPELVAPLLRSPEMVARLAPYLPEEHRSAAAIAELVSTPQFRHQLDLFSHALMTGQLDTSQFGLPPGGYGVRDFLKAIQAAADTEAAAKSSAAQPQPAAGEGQ